MSTAFPEAPPRAIRAADMAALLDVSTESLKRWAREGRIPCIRATQRSLRFLPTAVFRALERRHAQTRTKR